MRKVLFLFLVRIAFTQAIVLETQQIILPEYPTAHNPSIISFDQNYLLSFRYCPEPKQRPWISLIGIVLLDQKFLPISTPKLLDTRQTTNKTPSQSEDARLFFYQNKLYLIYNDNLEITSPNQKHRRDMIIAELFYIPSTQHFDIGPPQKLFYEQRQSILWQKNWIPFQWNDNLLLTYSLLPHEILYPVLENGQCYQCYTSQARFTWDFGTLRGSSSPQLIDGEFFAFFHSGLPVSSWASNGKKIWHYFCGAYTFASEPPFQLTKISKEPLIADQFYTQSNHEKRVIYPGGFILNDSEIYLAYGKDDCEMWIATLDKKALLESLIDVQ